MGDFLSKDTPQYVIDLARKMRKEPTPEEAVLWEAVRNNKLGVKFRNQHPLGQCFCGRTCFIDKDRVK
ncbi:MAG: DUF559 domain-containing protein [Firmicutes bacterium]|nr:DUF559 domain-containing protein [Bacillota bacterium]